MNRRGFLGALLIGGGTAAADVDLERLLWKRGAKKIFIPPDPKVGIVSYQTAEFLIHRELQVNLGDLVRLYVDPAANALAAGMDMECRHYRVTGITETVTRGISTQKITARRLFTLKHT